MIFLNSNFLLFMLLPLIILGYFIVTNKKKLDRVFDKKILKKLIIRQNYLGIYGKNILLFSTLILFIIALSRPVLPKEQIELKTKLPTYALLIDISASMLAKDLFPDRLRFSIKKAQQLLSKTNANITIYLFSDKLYQISPKTSDMKALIYLLKHLKVPKNLSTSSNLIDAIKNIKEKNILIFSDGTDIKEFSKLKPLKKELTLYLTATKKGAVIEKDGSLIKDSSSNIVITKANDAIKSVAKVIPFSYKTDDLKEMVSTKKEISFLLNNFKELYIYPLSLGTVLLFFIFFSPKNLKLFFIISLLSLYPNSSKALFLDFLDIQKATKAYQEKDYKEAIKYFKKVADAKRSPEAYYNLANAYYKNKEYKKALYYYKKVATKDDLLRYKTFFNLANSFYKLKMYEKAFEYYLFALEIKKTKKLENNLIATQKHIKGSKYKNKLVNIIQNNYDDDFEELELKTLIIPITKGDKNASKPW